MRLIPLAWAISFLGGLPEPRPTARFPTEQIIRIDRRTAFGE